MSKYFLIMMMAILLFPSLIIWQWIWTQEKYILHPNGYLKKTTIKTKIASKFILLAIFVWV